MFPILSVVAGRVTPLGGREVVDRFGRRRFVGPGRLSVVGQPLGDQAIASAMTGVAAERAEVMIASADRDDRLAAGAMEAIPRKGLIQSRHGRTSCEDEKRYLPFCASN